MTRAPMKVGVIGCGQISGIYLQNSKQFAAFEVVVVGDLRVEAAQARAAEYDIPTGCSVEELLANPEVELVINLTSHRAHGQVGLAVVEAGKHVYTEKPLVVYREEGEKLFAAAKRQGVRIGGAPDTFFGGAWQTARRLIDTGVIGQPIGALACLMDRRDPGPGRPRPVNPDGYVSFYYTDYWEYGAGLPFDRGAYYLTALIHLLGPVRRVTASAKTTWEERSDIGGGQVLPVHAPTHVAGLLDFANGAVCTMLMTSDVCSTGWPHVEIYGTEGSLRVIDPNNFGGQIYLRKPPSEELLPVECQFGYNQNSRGVGVADMATAIRSKRPHRASGEMAYHVVDIITAMHEASREGRHVELTTTCAQPAPLPLGLEDWAIDD